MFPRTERDSKNALIAAQPMTRIEPTIQPFGVNQTRIAATNAKAIVIRRKNEKKSPRVTGP